MAAGQSARLGIGDRPSGSLQLLRQCPSLITRCFAQKPILEFDRSSHPFRLHLIRRRSSSERLVEIPTGPGLGVESTARAEKYRALGTRRL